MTFENLQRYLSTSGDVQRILSIREWYAEDLKRKFSSGLSEDRFSFDQRNTYQCWVNYSAYFFRELLEIYMSLIERGLSEDDLSQFLENRFRVRRYFSQILLPGAYLDQSVPESTKLDFLNRFARSAENVIRATRSESDYRLLLHMKPLKEEEKKVIGSLIAVMKELCELVYFGEQPLGFPSFGLDTDSIPEFYTLHQDFDINLGNRKFSPAGRIKTITTYSRRGVPYILNIDSTHAQIFFHRIRGDPEWLPGRPHFNYLTTALVAMDGKELPIEEIEKVTELAMGTIPTIREHFNSLNEADLNLEYCDIQSRVIKNLHQVRGSEWFIPKYAEDAIIGNATMERLKREWGRQYSFEVSVNLIKKAVEWAEEKCSL